MIKASRKYFIAVAASSMFWWVVYFGGKAGVVPFFLLLLFYVPLSFTGNLVLGFVGIEPHEIGGEPAHVLVSYLSQLPMLIILSVLVVLIYDSSNSAGSKNL